MNNRTKKIILISSISVVVLTIATALIIRKYRINKGLGKVKIKNKNPKSILIVGDSQSAIKTADGRDITYTYPNLVEDKLKSKGVKIDVLAIVGKTTSWMKENLPSQLSKKKYDRVIIYGGGNDTSNSSIPLESTLKNIQDMVNVARENGADAFVNLGYKVQGDFGNYKIMPLTPYITKSEQWIPYVEKRKKLQELIPKKIKNANFIPAYDLQSKTTDGIHPTASGHKIVAEKVYDSIVKKILMNKKQKIILIALVSVVVLTLTTALVIRSRRKRGKNKSLRKKGTLVCSHIGKFDGAGEVQAENQLSNIKNLIDNNVDMVEVDVQITKDNVPVMFHDNTLEKKTNGSGSIPNKSWNEISSIRYNESSNARIDKLKDAIDYLKRKNSSTILQLDKTDSNEIKRIDNLGMFKGIEKNILCKGKSFEKPQAVTDAGIMWMPIIPDSYVGKMNKMSVIDEIVSKCKGSDFLEAQFSDADTLLIDGTLSKKLDKINCRLLVVAVGGSKLTNGASFRGDNEKVWSKMVNPMKAGVIMTNRPLKLQRYLKSVQ